MRQLYRRLLIRLASRMYWRALNANHLRPSERIYWAEYWLHVWSTT